MAEEKSVLEETEEVGSQGGEGRPWEVLNGRWEAVILEGQYCRE